MSSSHDADGPRRPCLPGAGILATILLAGSLMPDVGHGASLLEGRVELTGDVRLRWLQSDVDGGVITGLYGEPLRQQTSFLHRFTLAVEGRLTDRLMAGGLIRISNEPDRVLALGPDYFSSSFGSAFIAAQWPAFEARGGYYPVHTTPLGLMRWDREDLGLGGSQRGCSVCGGASAGVLLESLEEIDDDLTFEGARVGGTVDRFDLDWMVLYARPQAATLDEVPGIGVFDEETFRYHQDLITGRLIFSRLHAPTLGFRRLGLAVYHVRDDPANPPCPTLPESPTCFAHEQSAFGVDIRLPLGRRLLAEGEWLRTAAREDARGDSLPVAWENGFRLTGELVILPERLRLNSAYLWLGERFDSPYSALTYRPNRTGQRHRLTATLTAVDLEAFVRLTRPVAPEWVVANRARLHSERLLSGQGSFIWRERWRAIAGIQVERRELDVLAGWEGDYRDGDRRIVLAEIHYMMDVLDLYFSQQWIHEEEPRAAADTSTATVVALGARARF